MGESRETGSPWERCENREVKDGETSPAVGGTSSVLPAALKVCQFYV